MNKPLYFKKILLLVILNIFFYHYPSYSSNKKVNYNSDQIYNYFSGIVSSNENKTLQAYNYLKQTTFLRNKHDNFNIKFIQTIVELAKFNNEFA